MWKPIESLATRRTCTDYLVSHHGRPRLLWWDEDDNEWLGDNDREGGIPDGEVKFWFDLSPPPDAS